MQSQQPESQKNLLIAIALSAAVLMGWQLLYAGPKLKEEQEKQARIKQQTAQQAGPAAPGTITVPGAPGAPAVAVPAVALSRPAALETSPRVRVETPSLSGSIALKGGRIDDLSLVKYHETVDPKSANIELFSPSDGAHAYFAEYGWLAVAGAAQAMPGRDSLWILESGSTLSPGKPITLAFDNGQGLKFRRKIDVDDAAMFTVTDEVENKSSAAVTVFPYARIYRSGTPKVEGYYILHEGLIGVAGDKGLQELTYADIVKKPAGETLDKVTGGWLGFTDKYWASALIPGANEVYQASFRSPEVKTATTKESFQTQYMLAETVVPAGAKKSVEGRLFAGAKTVSQIEAYKSTYNIKLFDKMIDWGMFHFITKPLFFLIDWLSKLFGNFGLAILATTVIVKGLFFPLANKSYKSMALMKKVQPEMEKIKLRYPDKMDQQKAMMELYKKEKINPMAGCLPMLVQIPVFFALYKVLFVTIDMRQAPFYGWIRDLSVADPTTLFNLFGLLKFTPPDFLHVGIWPLIMGVTMWLQMQLNPQQQDPIQQQIFNWMPVMFTFMLGSFPAGLVIYWAWNNVLSIIQQGYIMKSSGVEVPIWKNIGLDKWFGGGGGSGGGASGVVTAPTATSAKKPALPVATMTKPEPVSVADAEAVDRDEADDKPAASSKPPQAQQPKAPQQLNMGKSGGKPQQPQGKPGNNNKPKR
jgi:YidC/Oxa1 family membrane protein insertase